MESVNSGQLYEDASGRLMKATENNDVEVVLSLYDNKAMKAEAAKLLSMSVKSFEEYVDRMLIAPQGKLFAEALRGGFHIHPRLRTPDGAGHRPDPHLWLFGHGKGHGVG